MLAIGHQVGGDAGKWNWQIVEASQTRVWKSNTIEMRKHPGRNLNPDGNCSPFFSPSSTVLGYSRASCLRQKCQVVERYLPAHHLVPTNVLHYVINLFRISPSGIDSTY